MRQSSESFHEHVRDRGSLRGAQMMIFHVRGKYSGIFLDMEVRLACGFWGVGLLHGGRRGNDFIHVENARR